MREIKFRAYDTRLKMWCYDGNGFALFGEVMLVDGFSSHFRENPALTDEGVYIPSLDRLYADIKIMQYAGLKDKNGKEIYEGDILGGRGKPDGIVKYEAACFILETNDEVAIWKQELRISLRHREVIGNIYENPELIKTINFTPS